MYTRVLLNFLLHGTVPSYDEIMMMCAVMKASLS